MSLYGIDVVNWLYGYHWLTYTSMFIRIGVVCSITGQNHVQYQVTRALTHTGYPVRMYKVQSDHAVLSICLWSWKSPDLRDQGGWKHLLTTPTKLIVYAFMHRLRPKQRSVNRTEEVPACSGQVLAILEERENRAADIIVQTLTKMKVDRSSRMFMERQLSAI